MAQQQSQSARAPEHIDKSWPFHFKNFERFVILTKGARVGDPEVTGYICNWAETNYYGIRAIQQELRHRIPDQRPLLVAGVIEVDVVEAAARLFGLELLRVGDGWKDTRDLLVQRSGGRRPIIIAATLGNSRGQTDDFSVIRRLSQELPIFLHVDASRTFDYMTTLSHAERQRLGVPKLVLTHPFDDSGPEKYSETIIAAATIVAGGTNCVNPPPTAILKPRSLGTPSEVKVEYVRGTDSTLAGSRDAIGPLWMCLQELRFGASGLRGIYLRCANNRRTMGNLLASRGVKVEAPPFSLDLIIHNVSLSTSSLKQWGLVSLSEGSYLLTVQPSITVSDVQGLLHDLTGHSIHHPCPRWLWPVNPSDSAKTRESIQIVKTVVDHFRAVGPRSGGYPLNQAPYSALGPIIGHFLPLTIPDEWTQTQATEILKARKTSFGLSVEEHASFPACFTTGSTMGNRVGIHNALVQYPNAFIYYSSATHYSVKKIVRDSDALTGIWSQGRRSRFTEIPADYLGRIIPTKLVEKVLDDKAHCASQGRDYHVVLLCNIGTTFTGGRDDIPTVRRALVAIGVQVSYIHVDGALDLGFAPDSVMLGPPDGPWERNGLPVVQGITLSHHKAYGIMVSGEVICHRPFCPGEQHNTNLIPTATAVDPRIVFETWLFQQLYTPSDLLRTRSYCVSNARRLRAALANAGVATRFNDDDTCFITLLERAALPPWLVEHFHLAPEGDWVHHVAMPHITPGAVDEFVGCVAGVEAQFATLFTALRTTLARLFGRNVRLQRLCAAAEGEEVRLRRVAVLARGVGLDVGDDAGAAGVPNDEFKRRYVYSGMSFAVFSGGNQHDEEDKEVLAVFLVGANADRVVNPARVITRHWEVGTLEKIKEYAFRYLAQEDGFRRGRNKSFGLACLRILVFKIGRAHV